LKTDDVPNIAEIRFPKNLIKPFKNSCFLTLVSDCLTIS